jgi:hypothetical protein
MPFGDGNMLWKIRELNVLTDFQNGKKAKD